RAHDLDPDNGVAAAAIYMARRQRNVNDYRNIKEERERGTLDGLNDADRMGPVGALKVGVEYNRDRWDEVKGRKPLTPIRLDRLKESEREIQRKLATPVTMNFEGAPLKQVIEDLRDVNGINIVVDRPALQSEGIDLESQVTIKLNKVSLKSALNLLLHQVHLTHVIKDEVLQITTEAYARGKLIPVTYQVADLVIPIENFGD